MKMSENAAIERVLAEGRLAQLTRAKERKLKQQLLQLENDVADAEDEADLARIMINFNLRTFGFRQRRQMI